MFDVCYVTMTLCYALLHYYLQSWICSFQINQDQGFRKVKSGTAQQHEVTSVFNLLHYFSVLSYSILRGLLYQLPVCITCCHLSCNDAEIYPKI